MGVHLSLLRNSDIGRRFLRFSHLSVKEYLFSSRSLDKKNPASFFAIREKMAHRFAAKISLIYLLSTSKQSPLFGYAAEYWPTHLRSVSLDARQEMERNLVTRLFGTEITKWLEVHDPDRRSVQGGNTIFPPSLYYSALLGLSLVTENLLEKGVNVNAQGGRYGNALQAASAEGHYGLVKTLLEKGADINAYGGCYYNALLAASTEGHYELVKMLLQKGADINAEGGVHGCALQAASAEGHDELVKMLLKKGADVNAQGGAHGNALQAASAEGYEVIVRALLECGADVNAQGGYYGNALTAAFRKGHGAVVRQLLKWGADVNPWNNISFLEEACINGDEIMVRALLEGGADVNTQGSIALPLADMSGHKAIVQALLERGADIKALDDDHLLETAFYTKQFLETRTIEPENEGDIRDRWLCKSNGWRYRDKLVCRL